VLYFSSALASIYMEMIKLSLPKWDPFFGMYSFTKMGQVHMIACWKQGQIEYTHVWGILSDGLCAIVSHLNLIWANKTSGPEYLNQIIIFCLALEHTVLHVLWVCGCICDHNFYGRKRQKLAITWDNVFKNKIKHSGPIHTNTSFHNYTYIAHTVHILYTHQGPITRHMFWNLEIHRNSRG